MKTCLYPQMIANLIAESQNEFEDIAKTNLLEIKPDLSEAISAFPDQEIYEYYYHFEDDDRSDNAFYDFLMLENGINKEKADDYITLRHNFSADLVRFENAFNWEIEKLLDHLIYCDVDTDVIKEVIGYLGCKFTSKFCDERDPKKKDRVKADEVSIIDHHYDNPFSYPPPPSAF